MEYGTNEVPEVAPIVQRILEMGENGAGQKVYRWVYYSDWEVVRLP